MLPFIPIVHVCPRNGEVKNRSCGVETKYHRTFYLKQMDGAEKNYAHKVGRMHSTSRGNSQEQRRLIYVCVIPLDISTCCDPALNQAVHDTFIVIPSFVRTPCCLPASLVELSAPNCAYMCENGKNLPTGILDPEKHQSILGLNPEGRNTIHNNIILTGPSISRVRNCRSTHPGRACPRRSAYSSRDSWEKEAKAGCEGGWDCSSPWSEHCCSLSNVRDALPIGRYNWNDFVGAVLWLDQDWDLIYKYYSFKFEWMVNMFGHEKITHAARKVLEHSRAEPTEG